MTDSWASTQGARHARRKRKQRLAPNGHKKPKNRQIIHVLHTNGTKNCTKKAEQKPTQLKMKLRLLFSSCQKKTPVQNRLEKHKIPIMGNWDSWLKTQLGKHNKWAIFEQCPFTTHQIIEETNWTRQKPYDSMIGNSFPALKNTSIHFISTGIPFVWLLCHLFPLDSIGLIRLPPFRLPLVRLYFHLWSRFLHHNQSLQLLLVESADPPYCHGFHYVEGHKPMLHQPMQR